MSIYENNPWSPVKYSIIKDSDLADHIFENGYKIAGQVSEEDIGELKALYNELHHIADDQGGMFYSVYSRDLKYREKVHQDIGKILSKYCDELFKDFKVIINSFVIKASGPKSEFYLHQDTTGLDETKFSPVNIWIPLQDVNEENGALAILPKSHRFFSPYRSISFPAPFDDIQHEVKKYLKSIPMKAGEILVFDNRCLHNSPKNTSGKTRIAVVSGLLPLSAKLTTCHKSAYELGGQVELIEHEDDFLLTYPKFLIDCQDRPHVGQSKGVVNDPYQAISKTEFARICAINGLEKQIENSEDIATDCNLIAEPVHKQDQQLNNVANTADLSGNFPGYSGKNSEQSFLQKFKQFWMSRK